MSEKLCVWALVFWEEQDDWGADLQTDRPWLINEGLLFVRSRKAICSNLTVRFIMDSFIN